jgi:hypothetical protein
MFGGSSGNAMIAQSVQLCKDSFKEINDPFYKLLPPFLFLIYSTKGSVYSSRYLFDPKIET